MVGHQSQLMPPSKQPHPLIDLLLTVILPSTVLEMLSKPERLGPSWALVMACLLPLGYGIYCWVTKAGLNFFSILGLVAVIVTGGLGLLKLSAFWFGVKEASVPLLIGAAFPLSHRWGKPLISSILFAPHAINETMIRQRLDDEGKQRTFEKLLFGASSGMGVAMVFSSLANLGMALWLLSGKEPGSEAYVKAIGTLNWSGMLVIGLPMMGAMMLVLMRFLRGVQTLTGLDKDDLLNPGTTVRRQV